MQQRLELRNSILMSEKAASGTIRSFPCLI